MEAFERTIVSQYSNSPTIVRLIESANEWIDPKADFDAFYRLVWDLSTAQGYGLDVWGRIVGIGRTLAVDIDETFFGFGGANSDYAPFNQAPFYNGQAATQNYVLSDTAYRTLILIKAAANIASTDSGSLNRLLRKLFEGRGRVYVSDYGRMMMRYTFEFYLEPFEAALLSRSGAIPKPAAVDVTLLQILPNSTFGFQEAGDAQPFGQGTFLAQESISHAV